MAASFERPKLSEQVIEYMTQMIMGNTWPPGMLLPPENVLAQELGVSRTVIRECIGVLSSRGMVEVHQGRGTFVTAPAAWRVTEPLALLVRADRASLVDWLEVRTILEVESARLAAERATGEDQSALRLALEQSTAANENPDNYCAADIHLHLTIAYAAHNPSLALLLHPILQPLREQLKDAAFLPQVRQASTHEHQEIVACILAGDGPGAHSAMKAHLNRVAHEIPVVLQEDPLESM